MSEAFYTELLIGLELEDRTLTREEVMNTPFKNIVESAEKILGGVQEQMKEYNQPHPLSISGPVLRGEGSDKLNDQELQYLLARQLQLHETEKMRLSMGR